VVNTIGPILGNPVYVGANAFHIDDHFGNRMLYFRVIRHGPGDRHGLFALNGLDCLVQHPLGIAVVHVGESYQCSGEDTEHEQVNTAGTWVHNE
jgi:hypothetical protein